MPSDEIVRAALERIVSALEEAREELDRLDAVGDDGDHGTKILQGATAARDAAAASADGQALAAAAAAWGAAPGHANALWGRMLEAAARAGDGPTATVDAMLGALEASTDAHIGDKSIVDTLAPALADAHARLERGEGVADAAAHAAGVAEEAAIETAAIEDRFDASNPDLGYPDPGATSSAVVLAAVAEVLAERG